MAGHRRCAFALLLAVSAGGCAPRLTASPERLAECTRLFNTWARYEQHSVFHHDGHKALAELALHRCEQGRYDEGIAELKGILRRGRFIVPD